MQISAEIWSEPSNSDIDQIFTISKKVYKALHPLDQLIAKSLLKVGKVRIIDDD